MRTRATPGPAALESKVAALPFLVEMIGSASAPTYVVTKVGHGLDASFKPGVVLEYWNGVPIDRAVQRHSDEEVGGRPDSQRAWAVQSLTLRSLQYGPPPDEHWVVVGYRRPSGRRSRPVEGDQAAVADRRPERDRAAAVGRADRQARQGAAAHARGRSGGRGDPRARRCCCSRRTR